MIRYESNISFFSRKYWEILFSNYCHNEKESPWEVISFSQVFCLLKYILNLDDEHQILQKSPVIQFSIIREYDFQTIKGFLRKSSINKSVKLS